MNRLSRLNTQICAIISSMPRKYEMKRRAERMQETRRRIAQAHMERDPLPDPSRWAEISGPEERLRRALSEVYAYYGGNEALLTNVLRDTPLDPVLQENNVFLFRHWEAMRDTIADAFEASGERHEALLAATALALDLQTWRTLVRQQGLDDDRAVELMIGMVRCLKRT